MDVGQIRGMGRRLNRFLGEFDDCFSRSEPRADLRAYVRGQLSDLERKSIEPIAARCVPDPRHVDAAHQRLQHFVTDSTWSDPAIRRFAAMHAVTAMTKHEPVSSTIHETKLRPSPSPCTGFDCEGRTR